MFFLAPGSVLVPMRSKKLSSFFVEANSLCSSRSIEKDEEK